MHEKPNSFTDLAFHSFPISRGDPAGQVELLRAARHLAPEIPLPPFEEFRDELVRTLEDFFQRPGSVHTNDLLVGFKMKEIEGQPNYMQLLEMAWKKTGLVLLKL